MQLSRLLIWGGLGLTIILWSGWIFWGDEATSKADVVCALDQVKMSLAQMVSSNSLKPKPFKIIEKTVKQGDTVSSILSAYLTPQQIYLLTKTAHSVYPLNRLRIGRLYRLVFKQDKLVRFEYEIDDLTCLQVKIDGDKFKVTKFPIKYQIKQTVVSGTIENNLFEAIAKTGEQPILAIKMADILGWDIDFIRDLQPGDSFALVVEKRFRQGKFAGYGRILAVKFINQGKEFYGFLYKNGDRLDYFDLQGRSLRKQFLKAPLAFTRISSKFSYRRYHPILHVVRPHLGVDYAAPKGTPIKTIADGTIIAIGRNREAGKYIKIRHKNGYESIYNHMCRFARGMRRGKKVEQGEVIGYVGQTGLATGPHLDLRVKRFGKYINPLKLNSKGGEPLAKSKLPQFQKNIAQYLPMLSQASCQKDLDKRNF